MAVACNPPAPTDCDELILRIELVDPSLLTDPTADATELAEETGATVSPWVVDVPVEAMTLSLASPLAPAICLVKLIPAASPALICSRDVFKFRENTTAGSPQTVSLSTASRTHPSMPPSIGVTESMFWSLKLIGSANAGEAAAPNAQIKPATTVDLTTSISSKFRWYLLRR